MGLETVTYITDLVVTNPVSSDAKTQGDDHLRAIKTGLAGSFPTASKAWYNPTSSSKTADFTVTAAMMNTLFYVSTASGTVTTTLPSLASGDAGWECSFVKTNTGTNPLFIAPASGTLQSGEVPSLAKCRRVIPGHVCKAVWTGSAWYVTRNCNTPVGGYIEGQWATTPVGFELPNGQTLSSASTNYPEFYSVNGSSGATLDLTGRATAMKEASATRLTSAGSGVTGSTLGSANGLTELTTMVRANLPNTAVNVTITMNSHDHLMNSKNTMAYFGASVSVGSNEIIFTNNGAATNIRTGGTVDTGSGTFNLNGSVTQTGFSVVQPTIVVNKVLVVE